MEEFCSVISDNFKDRKRCWYLSSLAIFPFWSIILYYIFVDYLEFIPYLILTLAAFILCAITIFFLLYLSLSRLSKNRLSVLSTKLVNEEKNRCITIKYDEVELIQAIRGFKGGIERLIIVFKKRHLVIQGFSQMDRLYAVLCEKVAGREVKVVERNDFFDLRSPLQRGILATFLIAAFIYLIIFHEELAYLMGYFAPLPLGVGLLIAGFLSKYRGTKKRVYFICTGTVLFLVSFVNIYLYLN